MGCKFYGNSQSQVIVCGSNVYKYPFNGRDYYFEWHAYCGAMPVKKADLSSRKSIPVGFNDMVGEWYNLSKEKQKEYLINEQGDY